MARPRNKPHDPQAGGNGEVLPACGICGKHKPLAVPVERVLPSLAAFLDTEHPGWRDTGYICRTDLQDYRRRALERMIRRERGELTAIDRLVVESMTDAAPLAANIEDSYASRITFGEKLADRVASFVGSWTFIITFLVVLICWMVLNAVILLARPFDPYPFILLNLVLSCVAAIQAPLIMMSQGRQEAKDRLRSENDYKVNLKAELEIRHLHEVVEHHLMQQWERLSELQEMQLELFEEITRREAE